MTLIEQLNEGIKESIRNKDTLRLNTLRMLKSKILAKDARGNIPDEEVLKLFKTYLGSLQEALEQSNSRPEIVKELQSEIAIVQEFLPNSPSSEETQEIVLKAISLSGAKSKKDLGLVMKEIKKLNPHIDGKLAKETADKFLT